MVLQLLVSVVYETVRHSWFVAAFSIKFLLAGVVARLVYENRLGLEELDVELMKYARETVAAIVVLGAAAAASGFKPPLFPGIVSEALAAGYFAYLFWRY
ncbi:MAG: hypothetical protein ABEI58_00240 [Candidatus Nanohaloarchaea archaeon]